MLNVSKRKFDGMEVQGQADYAKKPIRKTIETATVRASSES